ncbi:unnamed protein product [Diamesa serratosioi]
MSDSSSSVDEIVSANGSDRQGLKYLHHWPPVNLAFDDLVYSVNNGVDNNKVILRGVSGSFQSGQLTAIMGPSGAGKTTLLNSLAGLKCENVTGSIIVNGKQRDLKTFRRMSRFIMQQDIFQDMLTVQEVMMYAADLKLGYNDLSKEQKNEVIDEILILLRLEKTKDTLGNSLSGGELKRLSIALELLNNPPVLFLDEPTTGLDDMSSSQCIELLRRIAHGGRTVICSIHTPSAKIFAMFDHVYIMANAQCVYQGKGDYIVPYLDSLGLSCPTTYNPADFIIDVASGEYGHEYLDKMISSVDNGRVLKWTPGIDLNRYELADTINNNLPEDTINQFSQFEEEIDSRHLKSKCSNWQQFCVLFRRSSRQIYRNTNYLLIKFCMHIFLGIVIGGLFFQMGNDATKTLFNFGFCFTIIIAFMYIPMMPVLLEFPMQVQLLKREHFNRWYRLNPYFFAMTFAKFPIQLLNSLLYLTMVYLITDQPLELRRIALFYLISLLVCLTSESLGLLVASRLSVVNGMFVGPILTVPLMLLSVYGMGTGKYNTPLFVRLLMSLSYLRYGLEGIVEAIYGFDRKALICPSEEVFCVYKKPDFLLRLMGFEDLNFTVSVSALVVFYLTFNFLAFIMIRRRLSARSSNSWAVQYISRAVKNYLNFSPYKY